MLAADASLGGHLWVGACCNQPIGLSRSVNGGITWTTITNFVNVTDVDAAGDRVAVLGQCTGDSRDKIYYSGDAGVTWGEITRPGYRFGDAIAVAVDPWRAGTVWISSNGRSVARFTPGDPQGPTLTLAAESGNGLVLGWTLPDAGFVMQFSSSLSPAVWVVTNFPNIVTQATTKVAHFLRSAMPDSERGFFRMLKAP